MPLMGTTLFISLSIQHSDLFISPHVAPSCPGSKCLAAQGVLAQLHTFNQEHSSTPPPASGLQTPDPLNIINVALARQRDAVQAGCAAHPCPDNTNLVNTLYQRHQMLLQQQQQQQHQLEQQHQPEQQHHSEQQEQQQQQQHCEQQQQQYSKDQLHQQRLQHNKELACVEIDQVGLVQAADVDNQAACVATEVMVCPSPTFQGDTVPDTPLAAAEAAVQEAAAEAAQDASPGVKQHGGTEGAYVGGADSFLDLELGLGSRQSSSPAAAAVADTLVGSHGGKADDQHQVRQSQLSSCDLLMPMCLTVMAALSVWLFVCWSVLTTCVVLLSVLVCLYVCLSVCLYVCLPASLSVCPFVCLSVEQPVPASGNVQMNSGSASL